MDANDTFYKDCRAVLAISVCRGDRLQMKLYDVRFQGTFRNDVGLFL